MKLAAAILIVCTLGRCQPEPDADRVEVELFCREDSAEFAKRIEAKHHAGWRYLGQIANDGINCTWVAFGRR